MRWYLSILVKRSRIWIPKLWLIWISACSLAKCLMLCPNGFEKNEHGCEICKCKGGKAQWNKLCITWLSACPPFCLMFCPSGFEKDGNGCEICKCKKRKTYVENILLSSCKDTEKNHIANFKLDRSYTKADIFTEPHRNTLNLTFMYM